MKSSLNPQDSFEISIVELFAEFEPKGLLVSNLFKFILISDNGKMEIRPNKVMFELIYPGLMK